MFTKKFFSLLICVTISLFAQNDPCLNNDQNQEEALFLRRILHFWEEKNEVMVKNQISDFLQKHPNSAYCDQMHSILAQYCLEEENYSEALVHYANIVSTSFQKKFLLNQIQCLYKLQDFSSLIKLAEEKKNLLKTAEEKYQELQYFLGSSYLALSEQASEDTCSTTKQERLEKAEAIFSMLVEHKKDRTTFLPLANIYEKMGLYEKAAQTLFTAARLLPQEKETLLFEAAILERKYAPKKAVETFSQVYHLQGPKKGVAAYNKMLLLFAQKRYEELLLAKPLLFSSMNRQQKTTLHFFLGKAYEILEDYPRAIVSLQTFLSQAGPNAKEKNAAYLALAHAGFATNDSFLITQQIQALEKYFPNSSSTMEAYLFRAALETKKNNIIIAQKDYARALKLCSCPKKKQEITYQYAHLLYQNKDWQEAKNMASLFLMQAEESSKQAIAWKIFANAAIFATQENLQTNEQLLEDLQSCLESGACATKDRIVYLYYSAKAHFTKKQFADSIEIASFLLEEDLPDSLQGSVYLLLAESYLQGYANETSYGIYAEKALEFPLSVKNKISAQIGLFNIYLANYLEKKEELSLTKAQKYLMQAFLNKASIKKSNALWLFQSLYTKYENSSLKEDTIQEMQKLFTNIIDQNYSEEKQRENTLQMARLLGNGNKFAEKKSLLENFLRTHENQDLLWKSSIFASLADAYQALEETKLALQFYEQALHHGQFSLREKNTLAYKKAVSCWSFVQQGNTLDVKPILVSLKDIILQKKLEQEPLHLNAAFLYIDWSLLGLKGLERLEKRQFLLDKMLQNFLSQEDILSQDYQFARTQFPEKEEIFLSYMDLFDLEELCCKAAIACLKKEDYSSFVTAAKQLLEELTEITSTSFFTQRLESLQKELLSLH